MHKLGPEKKKKKGHGSRASKSFRESRKSGSPRKKNASMHTPDSSTRNRRIGARPSKSPKGFTRGQVLTIIDDALELPLVKNEQDPKQVTEAFLTLRSYIETNRVLSMAPPPRPSILSTIPGLMQNANIDNESREWLMLVFAQSSSMYLPSSSSLKQAKEKLGEEEQKLTLRPSNSFGSVFSSSERSSSSVSTSSVPQNVNESKFVDIGQWHFDIFAHDYDGLSEVVVKMFEMANLRTYCKISKEKLCNWIYEVRKRYRDNPYHNFRHGVDVCQTVFVFLYTFGCRGFIGENKQQMILGLMVASLCHDIDHPGLTNSYQINSMSDLALLYNDKSVLENHHCTTTFRILRNLDVNIFSELPSNEFRDVFRPLIYTLILNTDMTQHFAMLKEFDFLRGEGKIKPNQADPKPQQSLGKVHLTTENQNRPQKLSKIDSNERMTVMSIILHAADISNPCKPNQPNQPEQKNWAILINKEFLAQGEREKKENLPVSPNCDSSTSVQPEVALNFVDFIVAPTYLALSDVLPLVRSSLGKGKESPLHCLITNRKQWNEQIMSYIKNSTEKKEEELVKWKTREKTFISKYLNVSTQKRASVLMVQEFILANTTKNRDGNKE